MSLQYVKPHETKYIPAGAQSRPEMYQRNTEIIQGQIDRNITQNETVLDEARNNIVNNLHPRFREEAESQFTNIAQDLEQTYQTQGARNTRRGLRNKVQNFASQMRRPLELTQQLNTARERMREALEDSNVDSSSAQGFQSMIDFVEDDNGNLSVNPGVNEQLIRNWTDWDEFLTEESAKIKPNEYEHSNFIPQFVETESGISSSGIIGRMEQKGMGFYGPYQDEDGNFHEGRLMSGQERINDILKGKIMSDPEKMKQLEYELMFQQGLRFDGDKTYIDTENGRRYAVEVDGENGKEIEYLTQEELDVTRENEYEFYTKNDALGDKILSITNPEASARDHSSVSYSVRNAPTDEGGDPIYQNQSRSAYGGVGNADEVTAQSFQTRVVPPQDLTVSSLNTTLEEAERNIEGNLLQLEEAGAIDNLEFHQDGTFSYEENETSDEYRAALNNVELMNNEYSQNRRLEERIWERVSEEYGQELNRDIIREDDETFNENVREILNPPSSNSHFASLKYYAKGLPEFIKNQNGEQKHLDHWLNPNNALPPSTEINEEQRQALIDSRNEVYNEALKRGDYSDEYKTYAELLQANNRGYIIPTSVISHSDPDYVRRVEQAYSGNKFGYNTQNSYRFLGTNENAGRNVHEVYTDPEDFADAEKQFIGERKDENGQNQFVFRVFGLGEQGNSTLVETPNVNPQGFNLSTQEGITSRISTELSMALSNSSGEGSFNPFPQTQFMHNEQPVEIEVSRSLPTTNNDNSLIASRRLTDDQITAKIPVFYIETIDGVPTLQKRIHTKSYSSPADFTREATLLFGLHNPNEQIANDPAFLGGDTENKRMITYAEASRIIDQNQR